LFYYTSSHFALNYTHRILERKVKMMERNYSKDTKNAYQTLSTTIQANKEEVFFHLATTEGISSWFQQLSITKEKDAAFVLFDMGEDTFEKMSLVDYKTDDYIAFEWAAGKVEFQLEEASEGTRLILKETLPLSFSAIPEDFAGWDVQTKNIKQVLETATVGKVDPSEIKKVKEIIKKNLFED